LKGTDLRKHEREQLHRGETGKIEEPTDSSEGNRMDRLKQFYTANVQEGGNIFTGVGGNTLERDQNSIISSTLKPQVAATGL
jgi:hypothetical protein